MEPHGSLTDPDSKLYAFKLHKARVPYLRDKKWLSPLAVDEFFIDGDIEKAVVEGAAAAYDIHHPDYEWVPVQRYMGIFHEVQPAKNALKCNDCHGSEGRLDWKALGYGQDPRKKK